MAPLPRLTRRAEFLKVAAARRKWAAPGLILQAAGAPQGAVSWRVGFTASRKVGNAEAGHDYVLIARSATLSRNYGALLADLEEGLRRLGLYRA